MILTGSDSRQKLTSQSPNTRTFSRRAKRHRASWTLCMPETELNPNEPTQNGFKRTESEEKDLIRILIQALYDHGYETAANALQEESGIQMESPSVQEFRSCILKGEYDDALSAMPISDQIRFEIKKDKYLELLEARRIKDALECLRNEVTPIASDSDAVQKLAALIMASTAQEVRVKSQWCGAGIASRQALLGRIQKLIPGIMLPVRRLDQLLSQAFKYQEKNCYSHFPGPDFNGIILDHQCYETDLELQLDLRLEGHTDEVWFAAFSHDGHYLATASKDKTAIIWSVPDGQIVHILNDHAAAVLHLAWSPDSKTILTCSLDSRARLWDARTGECSRLFLMNGETTAGVWVDKGQSIIIASQDGLLTKFSKDGTTSVTRNIRSLDMASIDGNRIAVLDNQKTVHILNSSNLEEITKFTEIAQISSIAVSRDGNKFLLNAADAEQAEVNLWEPSLPNDRYDVQFTYYGHQNRKYLLRSCFAHESEILIVTGCETGNIYVFHRTNAHVIQKICAHKGPVNCVTWTDRHGGLLASVSDDHYVGIWRKTASNS